MKLTNYILRLCILTIIIGTFSCKENSDATEELNDQKEEIGVFDFDNAKELSAYNQMNLDETHPNLLNPQISSSDYNTVMASWTDLHNRIGSFLSENQFEWGVQDSTITIVHKIYFKPDGKIENYFFNVLNKEVTNEKRERFSHLIAEFARNSSIDYQKNDPFAQCGKTRYVNE